MSNKKSKSEKIKELQAELKAYKKKVELADEYTEKLKQQLEELKAKRREYDVLIQELKILRKLYPFEDDDLK